MPGQGGTKVHAAELPEAIAFAVEGGGWRVGVSVRRRRQRVHLDGVPVCNV